MAAKSDTGRTLNWRHIRRHIRRGSAEAPQRTFQLGVAGWGPAEQKQLHSLVCGQQERCGFGVYFCPNPPQTFKKARGRACSSFQQVTKSHHQQQKQQPQTHKVCVLGGSLKNTLIRSNRAPGVSDTLEGFCYANAPQHVQGGEHVSSVKRLL